MSSITDEPSSSNSSPVDEIHRLKKLIIAKDEEMRNKTQAFRRLLADERIRIALEMGGQNAVHNCLMGEMTAKNRTITALRRHNDALAQRVDGFKQMFEEQDAQFANLQVQVEAVCEENAALRKELEVIKEGQSADPTTVAKKD
ncbi:hypothetical protein L5515_015416 [Caenorhabditis briggsae]|uniref:Uncharacterized protein n=1 Tax=Caenorhabditis briggsae TaxID=6238 RepID=A0AAE9EE50_CAEBR|nr:hypothetical protein L5515_015416 [Caenorhabditis briggsae]